MQHVALMKHSKSICQWCHLWYYLKVRKSYPISLYAILHLLQSEDVKALARNLTQELTFHDAYLKHKAQSLRWTALSNIYLFGQFTTGTLNIPIKILEFINMFYIKAAVYLTSLQNHLQAAKCPDVNVLQVNMQNTAWVPGWKTYRWAFGYRYVTCRIDQGTSGFQVTHSNQLFDLNPLLTLGFPLPLWAWHHCAAF